MNRINTKRDLEIISSLSSLIDVHLDDDSLNVNDFANKLSISRLKLYRLVKTITGHSPSIFIRNHRLEKASNLLTQSDLSIAQVATQVGFGNTKYFSTVFKNKYGLSPSSYIKVTQKSHDNEDIHNQSETQLSNLHYPTFK